mmetsp:Transcript_59103/g.128300  ORF Transcript_59103/g.128300 Transcript_59103/m.128300 type:complete len:197 (-) Transcript_59103:330-920(-)
MFSLLAGFWQLIFRRVEFHILILGVDSAGKTTLLEQMKAVFLGKEPLAPGKIAPTIGLNIGRMQIRRAKMIFWDLGGQSALRTIWEKYFAEAHGLIYVVDASESERFEESRAVLLDLLAHPDLADVPLLLLANKQDIEGAISPQEIESRFGLQKVNRQPRMVVGTAALSGDGIQEGISWLVDALRESPRAMGVQQM